MAVPYPPDGPISYDQEMDYRVAMASKVILEEIDELPDWEAISQQLATRLRLSLADGVERAQVQTAFLAAELDLEWTNAIVYEADHFRRPGGVDDPAPVAPERLSEVADAVWSLGWPNPGRKPSRTIHGCFLALDGRYRHCDVYWAMHRFLKGNRLRVVRANWMLLADVQAVLADTSLNAVEREELERQLEEDLVFAYLAWLGRRDVRKYRFKNGREADLYDRSRQLIIEAKASHSDDVMVAHGMGQAMYYRSFNELGTADRIAVLLPGRPGEDVALLLRTYDVGLICRAGDAFTEELF